MPRSPSHVPLFSPLGRDRGGRRHGRHQRRRKAAGGGPQRDAARRQGSLGRLGGNDGDVWL